MDAAEVWEACRRHVGLGRPRHDTDLSRPWHGTSAAVDSASLAMASRIREELRVLVANERDERIALITRVVNDLGHVVIAASTDVGEVGALTRRELPDVALVGLGVSSGHALDLIGQIVREAACPVIALLEAEDRRYVSSPPSAACSPTSSTATRRSCRARSR